MTDQPVGRPVHANHGAVSAFAPKPRQAPAATSGITPIPLGEQHAAGFEADLRERYGLLAERDALRQEVAGLKTELSAARATIQMLEAGINASDARVTSYQCERDQAVADRSKWETLYVSILAQLHAFPLPATPLVKVIDDTPPFAP